MSNAWPSGSERIGLVTGLTGEARIARRFGWQIAVGGGDAAGAARAARQLTDSGATALVSFGLAGGLEPALPAGTVLVPVAVHARDQVWEADQGLAARLGGVTPHRLLGATAIARTAGEKRELREVSGCSAVDLESASVAAEAARCGLPFAVVRAICDPATMDLPPAAMVTLSARGAISPARVLGSVMARPSQIGALFLLARCAAQARRALLRHLASIQAHFPPPPPK